MNEFLLIFSLILIYLGVLAAYRFFGTAGLYCGTVFATITANIEVLLLVDAFGLEQTLGNILFAATFLITDILSEKSGAKGSESGNGYLNGVYCDFPAVAAVQACGKRLGAKQL